MRIIKNKGRIRSKMAEDEKVDYEITIDEPSTEGFAENDAIYFILNYLVEDEEEEKEYRADLKKRDSKKYKEYLSYEKFRKEAEKE